MWRDAVESDGLRAIDQLVAEVLAQAGWTEPPIDVVALAKRLGMSIAVDSRQEPRGRHMRIDGRTAIFVRPEPRPERLQWTVAHEIGESLAHRLQTRQSANDLADGEREQRANQLATRLLLPRGWFERDARDCRNDLFELKKLYSTASHELIAWRLLDGDEPAVTTVIDQGRMTRRRGNLPGRLPPWTTGERACLVEVQATGRPARRDEREFQVTAWPVHEPGWRREIVRLVWRGENVAADFSD